MKKMRNTLHKLSSNIIAYSVIFPCIISACLSLFVLWSWIFLIGEYINTQLLFSILASTLAIGYLFTVSLVVFTFTYLAWTTINTLFWDKSVFSISVRILCKLVISIMVLFTTLKIADLGVNIWIKISPNSFFDFLHLFPSIKTQVLQNTMCYINPQDNLTTTSQVDTPVAQSSSGQSTETSSTSDLQKKNDIVRRLFSVNPSNSYTDRNWTLSIEERANLDRRFKIELAAFLPTKGHYTVDTSRQTGLIDNNQFLSTQYSSYTKYDEYYFYKMGFFERFKEGMSDSDRNAFGGKLSALKQTQLDHWSQGRLHCFSNTKPSLFSREIISLADISGLRPNHTVDYYMLPRFMQQSLERSI